jgi:hypothetical protein
MPKSVSLIDYRQDRMDPGNPEYEPVRLTVEEAMNRDVRRAAANVGAEGARFFVQAYYRAQRERIQTGNQIRALTESGEPTLTLEFFNSQAAKTEANYKAVLGVWALQTEAGVWAQSVYGCGPVLSAVCSAYFDISRCPTVGHMWSYAGLLPPSQQPWEKGQKRPWNADLKVAMWKLGRCFVRSSTNDKSFYGAIYRQRKEYEILRNERGGNAACAASTLAERNITDEATRACYTGAPNCSHDRAVPKKLPRPEIGIAHLPPGRIDLRASRYAVKLFLAHWFDVAFREYHRPHAVNPAEWKECFCMGTGNPPLPYPIAMQPGSEHDPMCAPAGKRIFATFAAARAAILTEGAAEAYACEFPAGTPHFHLRTGDLRSDGSEPGLVRGPEEEMKLVLPPDITV